MINKKYIRDLIGRSDAILFEIGCNDGTDTSEFLKVSPQSSMYCFEPDPRAITDFRSKCLPRTELYEGCLSNEEGTVDFWMSDGRARPECDINNKSGSIREPKMHLIRHPWCTFDKKTKVSTTRLDTWMTERDIPIIDFVWADVQGAEEDVLKGGINTFTNKVRYLYTEYSDEELYDGQINLAGICAILPGYEVLSLHGNNALMVNKTLQEMV